MKQSALLIEQPALMDSLARVLLAEHGDHPDPVCWANAVECRLFCSAMQGDSLTSDSLLAIAVGHHRSARNQSALSRAYRRCGEGWYRRTVLPKAMTLMDSAVITSRRSDDKVELAAALCSRAAIAMDAETPMRAITLAMEALHELGQPPMDTTLHLRALSNLGLYHAWSGQVDSAMHYHHMAIEGLQHAPNEKMLAWNRMNLATVLIDQGSYDAGMELLEQARDHYERTNDLFDLGTCLFYLGYCQQHSLTADRVVDTYERVIAIYDSLDLSNRGLMASMTLGRYLIDLDSADVARAGMTVQARNELAYQHGQAALRQTRIVGANNQLGEVLDALCDVERALRMYDSSLVHAHEAIRIRAVNGDGARLASSYKDLGATLHAMGRSKEAGHALRTGLDTLAISPHPEIEASLHEVYHGILAAQGDHRSAYKHLLTAGALREGLMDEEKRQDVVQRKLRYEFDRRQLQDSLQHAARIREAQDQRTIAELETRQATRLAWALGLGGGLLILATGSGFYLDRRRRQERFRRRAAELENKALRAQMDPHFIGNTLHTVNAYLLTNDSTTASKLLSRFAKWIRLMLEHGRRDEVSLQEDLEAMRQYLDLERIRTKEKFDFTVEVAPHLPAAAIRIPPMLVQPFLENAINHGIMPKEGKGHIRLTAGQRGNDLLITVADDGVGREKADNGRATDKASLSSAITQDRLHYLEQRTGRKGSLRLLDTDHGLRVELLVPLGRASQ